MFYSAELIDFFPILGTVHFYLFLAHPTAYIGTLKTFVILAMDSSRDIFDAILTLFFDFSQANSIDFSLFHFLGRRI